MLIRIEDIENKIFNINPYYIESIYKLRDQDGFVVRMPGGDIQISKDCAEFIIQTCKEDFGPFKSD